LIRTILNILAVLLVAGACIYGGYLLLQGTELTMPALLSPPKGPRLIMSMERFRVAQSEQGSVSWIMDASNADLYESKQAELKDVQVVFKGTDEREATLRGDLATMDTAQGNTSLRRSTREVRVVTSDGYLLTTDSLFWTADKREIRTSDPFKLLGSEIYLEGVGLTANVDMSTIVVNNNVKAVLQQ
jgi:LPS export ABC transporter protein LptC